MVSAWYRQYVQGGSSHPVLSGLGNRGGAHGGNKLAAALRRRGGGRVTAASVLGPVAGVA